LTETFRENEMASKPHRPSLMQAFNEADSYGSLLCSEPHFYQRLQLEEKRTGRSGKSFLLLLLNCSSFLDRSRGKSESLKKIRRALYSCLRETDVRGWFKEDVIIGVILTEIAQIDDIVRKQIANKVRNTLSQFLGQEEAKEISMSLHVFPEDLRNRWAGDRESLVNSMPEV